jgi:DNA replication protein DnaC
LNEKNLPPGVFNTGEICPECGEPIYAAKISVGGKTRLLKKPCSCRSARLRAENAEKKARDRAARLEMNRRLCADCAKIPDTFAGASLNGYRRLPGTREAFDAVKEYLLNRAGNFRAGKGLMLCGPCGTGKTHLGCAILNRALDDGLRAAYFNVPDLLDRLLPGRAPQEDQGGLMRCACSSGVLLLDDLGAEKPSEWTQKQLTIILDARYRENRPTFITTNLAGKNLAGSCGARVYSRLMDASKTRVVLLTGGDFRRLKGSEE